MRFCCRRLITGILAGLLSASFTDKTLFIDRVQVLPLAPSAIKNSCMRLYTRCSAARPSNQPVPSKSVFLPCKRNGWKWNCCKHLFDEFDPKHCALVSVYIRSVIYNRIQLLYVLFTVSAVCFFPGPRVCGCHAIQAGQIPKRSVRVPSAPFAFRCGHLFFKAPLFGGIRTHG